MANDPKTRHFIPSELRPEPRVTEGPPLDPGAAPAEISLAARRALGEAQASRLGLAGTPAEAPSDTAVFAHSHDVSSTLLDGEAVVLDLESGRYFTLNRTATAVWELLDGARSVGEILAALGVRFTGDIETLRRHVGALLDDLERKKLVERRPRSE